MTRQSTRLACACGQVVLEAEGKSIVSAECLCTDCQKAGALLQSLPDAPRLLDANGATRYELYRKDRVRCEQGAHFLREHRLHAKTKTRRVVAVCCNTPMFLDFTGGHWLSMYGNRWPGGALPPLEIRVMTRSRPQGAVLAHDVPNPRVATPWFFARLFRAWLGMGLRIPRVEFVHGELDAR